MLLRQQCVRTLANPPPKVWHSLDKGWDTAKIRSLLYNTTVQPEVRSESIIRKKEKIKYYKQQKNYQKKYTGLEKIKTHDFLFSSILHPVKVRITSQRLCFPIKVSRGLRWGSAHTGHRAPEVLFPLWKSFFYYKVELCMGAPAPS